MSVSGESASSRIAIVRPSALGDVCRTVPALVSLRRAFPHAHIEWIVQDSFVDAISAHPDLNGVIPFPRRQFSRFGTSLAATRGWFQWSRSLKKRRFECVFDLQGLARSGVITWATRAPVRVGFADAREAAFLAYTHRHRIAPDRHAVDRMLDLLAAQQIEPVYDMRLYVPPPGQEVWNELITSQGINKDSFAIIAPTSRWEGKRWPPERFALVAKYLLENRSTDVVIVGSDNERPQCHPLFQALRQHPRVFDLVGRTSIASLMAAISAAKLVVANDSAALHMAVGLDTPYVALFGPTRTHLVGPWRGDRWVVQPADIDISVSHKDTDKARAIMRRITVEQVIEKVDERLATSKTSDSPT